MYYYLMIQLWVMSIINTVLLNEKYYTNPFGKK